MWNYLGFSNSKARDSVVLNCGHNCLYHFPGHEPSCSNVNVVTARSYPWSWSDLTVNNFLVMCISEFFYLPFRYFSTSMLIASRFRVFPYWWSEVIDIDGPFLWILRLHPCKLISFGWLTKNGAKVTISNGPGPPALLPALCPLARGEWWDDHSGISWNPMDQHVDYVGFPDKSW